MNLRWVRDPTLRSMPTLRITMTTLTQKSPSLVGLIMDQSLTPSCSIITTNVIIEKAPTVREARRIDRGGASENRLPNQALNCQLDNSKSSAMMVLKEIVGRPRRTPCPKKKKKSIE